MFSPSWGVKASVILSFSGCHPLSFSLPLLLVPPSDLPGSLS